MVFAWKKSAKSSQTTTKSTALKEHSKNAIDPSKQFEFGKKSAVEFLDETKAFYVKSKSVRDHKQILPIRPISSSHSFSVRSHNHNHSPLPPSCFNYFHSVEASPAKSLPSAKINRRSTPVNSDVLQVKLRELINSETFRNSGADVTKHSAISDSKLGDDNDNSESSDDDVISPPSEYAAGASSAFRLRTRSRTQPSISAVHKSLPNLNCDTPVNFTATFKDSFDDSSGHFTQPSADGSAGSVSVSMTTTSRAHQMPTCCERNDESERKQPHNHLMKPQHQQRHSRDSGSSTQHSDSSLHNKFSNICASSSSLEPKPLYESQLNANSNYGVKSISFIKYDEPHPSKLWNRSGLKNVREKSMISEQAINEGIQKKTGVKDKPKMTRLATSTATAAPTSAVIASAVVVDDNNNNRNIKGKADEWSKPILRSKSDIGDRYGHYRNWSTPLFVTGCEAKLKPSTYSRSLSPGDVHYFFKYLGMSKEMFGEVVGSGQVSANSIVECSTKVASGAASVCVMQKPLSHERQTRGASNDSSEMSSFASSANIRYCDLEDRNFEAVSIVERNARIIKWLCNCRKSQIALSNRNASLV